MEIYNQLWLMGPCFKSYLSHKFDRPEAIRDRAKTDEFLRSLCTETLRKLFGAIDASECFLIRLFITFFKSNFQISFFYENLSVLVKCEKLHKIVGNFFGEL